MLATGTIPDDVRLALLSYGSRNSYRVVTADEVSQTLVGFSPDEIRQCLDQLATEELLTRFVGRYCFNKELPFPLKSVAARQALNGAR